MSAAGQPRVVASGGSLPRRRVAGCAGFAEDASDEALLGRCRVGDGAAWDALVRRYERLVFSVALRNGVGREDASDVTQSVFMSLLESLGQLREDERLASWLMTVARRQTWRLRERERRQAAAVEHAQLLHGADRPIDDWERAATVHDALHALGQPCRELLVSLYFDPSEPSYAGVARRLGRAIGSIGPARARCLEKLRALLGEDG